MSRNKLYAHSHDTMMVCLLNASHDGKYCMRMQPYPITFNYMVCKDSAKLLLLLCC